MNMSTILKKLIQNLNERRENKGENYSNIEKINKIIDNNPYDRNAISSLLINIISGGGGAFDLYKHTASVAYLMNTMAVDLDSEIFLDRDICLMLLKNELDDLYKLFLAIENNKAKERIELYDQDNINIKATPEEIKKRDIAYTWDLFQPATSNYDRFTQLKNIFKSDLVNNKGLLWGMSTLLGDIETCEQDDKVKQKAGLIIILNTIIEVTIKEKREMLESYFTSSEITIPDSLQRAETSTHTSEDAFEEMPESMEIEPEVFESKLDPRNQSDNEDQFYDSDEERHLKRPRSSFNFSPFSLSKPKSKNQQQMEQTQTKKFG